MYAGEREKVSLSYVEYAATTAGVHVLRTNNAGLATA